MDVERNEPIEGNDQTNGLAGNLEGDGKDSEEPEVDQSIMGDIVIEKGLGFDHNDQRDVEDHRDRD